MPRWLPAVAPCYSVIHTSAWLTMKTKSYTPPALTDFGLVGHTTSAKGEGQNVDQIYDQGTAVGTSIGISIDACVTTDPRPGGICR